MIAHECRFSGCHAIISTNKRYCDKHMNVYSRRYDKERMTNKVTRDYRLFYQSKEWKKLRLYKLSINPLCESCLKNNLYINATDVHHIDDVFNHYDKRLDLDNLTALCKSCHEKIHKLGYYPPL